MEILWATASHSGVDKGRFYPKLCKKDYIAANRWRCSSYAYKQIWIPYICEKSQRGSVFKVKRSILKHFYFARHLPKKTKKFWNCGSQENTIRRKKKNFGKCLAKYKCFMIDLLTLNKRSRWNFSHMCGIHICLYSL